VLLARWRTETGRRTIGIGAIVGSLPHALKASLAARDRAGSLTLFNVRMRRVCWHWPGRPGRPGVSRQSQKCSARRNCSRSRRQSGRQVRQRVRRPAWPAWRRPRRPRRLSAGGRDPQLGPRLDDVGILKRGKAGVFGVLGARRLYDLAEAIAVPKYFSASFHRLSSSRTT